MSIDDEILSKSRQFTPPLRGSRFTFRILCLQSDLRRVRGPVPVRILKRLRDSFELHQRHENRYRQFPNPKRYSRQSPGRSATEMQPFDRQLKRAVWESLRFDMEERAAAEELQLAAFGLRHNGSDEAEVEFGRLRFDEGEHQLLF